MQIAIKTVRKGKVQEMVGDAHTTLVHDFQCSKTDSLQFNCLFTIDCKADIDELVVNATPITKNAQVCGKVCIGVITVRP